MSRFVPLLMLLAGCSAPPPVPSEPPAEDAPRMRPPNPAAAIEPKNVIFTPDPADLAAAPAFRPVALPAVHGGAAVWGATGRDHRGRIYVGVSCEGVEPASAHLLEIEPEINRTRDLGGAVEHLTRLGLQRPGESQNKIHTKIVQAGDGNLYFASMDEGGEAEDGSKLPTFGSHLWRLTPGAAEWQHLAAVPEGVIAAATGGRFVYFLAYYGHVLLQLDPQTCAIARRVRVGSVGGHTTRNIVADRRGHVFVPRVTAENATLIEFDDELNEVGSTKLEGYSTTPDSNSHGLVGVAPLENGGWILATDRGRLYRLDPRATGTSVQDLGFLHPAGESYTAALFSYDGRGHVVGVGHRHAPDAPFEWLTFDLKAKTATAVPVDVPMPGKKPRLLLLYGSTTRDDQGAFYVVGRYVRRAEHREESVPAVYRVAGLGLRTAD